MKLNEAASNELINAVRAELEAAVHPHVMFFATDEIIGAGCAFTSLAKIAAIAAALDKLPGSLHVTHHPMCGIDHIGLHKDGEGDGITTFENVGSFPVTGKKLVRHDSIELAISSFDPRL